MADGVICLHWLRSANESNTVSVQIQPMSQTHTNAKMHNYVLVYFSNMTDAIGSVDAAF